MATDSTSVYWLSKADLLLIGVNPPYLQEKLIATCYSELPEATADLDRDAANRFYLIVLTAWSKTKDGHSLRACVSEGSRRIVGRCNGGY